jgi:transcription factor SFP1
VRENQLLNGLAGVGGFVGEEIKPFKCPVIGCEKAYKNQNGLKYHKQHGHQNQQLKENPDGTFSIVDPATSIPYPGTVGMEKEKPYRCEVCGKRYKNLNGLKYHRQHSPPCNPDFKLQQQNVPGMPNNLQGMSVNVAGAGLNGMAAGIGY